jgi:hypothetical protein
MSIIVLFWLSVIGMLVVFAVDIIQKRRSDSR